MIFSLVSLTCSCLFWQQWPYVYFFIHRATFLQICDYSSHTSKKITHIKLPILALECCNNLIEKRFAALGFIFKLLHPFSGSSAAVQSCGTSVSEPFALFSLSIIASLLIAVKHRDAFIHLLLFNTCNQQPFKIYVLVITSSLFNIVCVLHTCSLSVFPHIQVRKQHVFVVVLSCLLTFFSPSRLSGSCG